MLSRVRCLTLAEGNWRRSRKTMEHNGYTSRSQSSLTLVMVWRMFLCNIFLCKRGNCPLRKQSGFRKENVRSYRYLIIKEECSVGRNNQQTQTDRNTDRPTNRDRIGIHCVAVGPLVWLQRHEPGLICQQAHHGSLTGSQSHRKSAFKQGGPTLI